MKKYSFHPEAALEFMESIEYYEECKKGLGYDFAAEVYISIQRILANPDAWQIIEKDIRRSLVRRFPFGILYTKEENEIYILAVMNLHRDPDYWKNRI